MKWAVMLLSVSCVVQGIALDVMSHQMTEDSRMIARQAETNRITGRIIDDLDARVRDMQSRQFSFPEVSDLKKI